MFVGIRPVAAFTLENLDRLGLVVVEMIEEGDPSDPPHILVKNELPGTVERMGPDRQTSEFLVNRLNVPLVPFVMVPTQGHSHAFGRCVGPREDVLEAEPARLR